MLSRAMHVRFGVCATLLVVATVLLHGLGHGEPMLNRQTLKQFPAEVGDRFAKDSPLTDRILKAAGVDDYLNREYFRAGAAPVSLYIGYYASQRTGDTIHSPKNCLPGAGWEPVHAEELAVPLNGGRSMVVNEYLIAKGLDRELVLYWYQSRGRVIASEYRAKFWMVGDAIARNRTDGALVRLIAPVGKDEQSARAQLLEFARAIEPELSKYVPN